MGFIQRQVRTAAGVQNLHKEDSAPVKEHLGVGLYKLQGRNIWCRVVYIFFSFLHKKLQIIRQRMFQKVADLSLCF